LLKYTAQVGIVNRHKIAYNTLLLKLNKVKYNSLTRNSWERRFFYTFRSENPVKGSKYAYLARMDKGRRLEEGAA
jgi:hypothetical protein